MVAGTPPPCVCMESDGTELCSDDDLQAPAPAQSGKKAAKRPAYCPQQRAFVEQRRKAFDANPRSTAAHGWIVPPPAPSFTVRHGQLPDASAWWLKPWGGWVPERLYPAAVSAPPCPYCPRSSSGSVNAAAAKWQRRLPRFVLTQRPNAGGFFFLDSKTYRCNEAGCGKSF